MRPLALPIYRSAQLAILCLTATAHSSCSKSSALTRHAPNVPDIAAATNQTKCPVRRSLEKPLIVEWPAAERGQLESLATEELVVVRYTGCEIEILPACHAAGTYSYIGLNRKTETVKIRNIDELYSTIPIGAVRFEGELNRTGELGVEMIIVGRKEAPKREFTNDELWGQRCEDATHVITGLSVGAFSFYSTDEAAAGAEIGVGPATVGGSSATSRRILREDGKRTACDSSQEGDDDAPRNCGALIRIEVSPLRSVMGEIARVAKEETAPRVESAKESPRQEVFIEGGVLWGHRVESFHIDKTEVSTSEYGKCVRAEVCRPPKSRNRDLYNWNYRSKHPINGVNWQDAKVFCEWRGQRLPTTWEWRWVAQGRDEDRPFPWGEEPADCSRTVMAMREWGCGAGTTWEVGTQASDVTRDGVLDMAGNVSEWLADPGRERAMTGGISFKSYWNHWPGRDFVADAIYKRNWNTRSIDIGFRCVTPSDGQKNEESASSLSQEMLGGLQNQPAADSGTTNLRNTKLVSTGAILSVLGGMGLSAVVVGGAIRWDAYRKSLLLSEDDATIQQLIQRQRTGNITMLVAAPFAAVGLGVGIPFLVRGLKKRQAASAKGVRRMMFGAHVNAEGGMATVSGRF